MLIVCLYIDFNVEIQWMATTVKGQKCKEKQYWMFSSNSRSYYISNKGRGIFGQIDGNLHLSALKSTIKDGEKIQTKLA